MDLGAFRGAQDINRSQIIISDHAWQRFYKHLNNQLRTAKIKNLTKKQRKMFREEFGFSPEEISNDLTQVEPLIRKLLHYSTHENASYKGQAVQAIFNYQEETYYLRNGRWQFRITRSKERPENFILKTIVWLNDYKYSPCFKK